MKLARVFGALAVAVAAVALVSAPAFAQAPKFFRIGTGGAGGTYYPIGGIIATGISSPPGARPCDKGGSCGVPGLVATAVATDGSIANVNGIVGGTMESGFSQADVAYWAYTGTGLFEGKPKQEKLRVIANLYPEHIQVVTRADAGIKGAADLKGKRVNMGMPASGTLVGARMYFGALGLKEGADIQPEYLNNAQAVARMRDNQLDVNFIVAGYPTAAVVELASTTGAGIVSLSEEMVAKLVKEVPYWAPATIPAGTYKGIDTETRTVAVGAQWLTSSDQDPELVYQITKALWNEHTRGLLDAGHAKGKAIVREHALDGVSLPLHPGAARFYKEVGLLK